MQRQGAPPRSRAFGNSQAERQVTGRQRVSVAVAGAGHTGLAAALAFAERLGATASVAVYDPALTGPPAPDPRHFALTPASRRLLQRIGVWDGLGAVQPIVRMEITDSRLADPVRPTLLAFGASGSQDAPEDDAAEDGEPLAHMAGSDTLRAALRRRAAEARIALVPRAVTGRAPEGGFALDDGAIIRPDLIVVADGARSRLREALGVGWVSRPFGQHGIVATIAHERDHGGVAVQHFLPSGPFAILPLPPGGRLGHRSSIVWSERSDAVEGLSHADEADILREIGRRFGHRLGAIALETPVRPYPLAAGIARRFAGADFALVGDTAHVVHPIAGQGLNLGLGDVECLVREVAGAVRLGLEPADGEALRSYERARRPHTLGMGLAMAGLNGLFSNDAGPLRLARDIGMGIVDRAPRLKAALMRRASGVG